MMPLPPMWQITPLGVLAVVVLVANAIGVRRLGRRQTAPHRRRTYHRAVLFTAGLVILAAVVSGPLDRYAMSWLSVHMAVHVVEMFYLPPLLLLGSPRVTLPFALPVSLRRRLLTSYYRARRTAPLAAVGRVAGHPISAVVMFNVVMVTWHIPAVYDWASWHTWVMNWLMAPSFLVSGVLFWRVILPSYPAAPRGSLGVQTLGIVVTAFEMLVLAMSMAIFTKAPWYSMNVMMDGPAAALRDQHWAAGILWVCGDTWAVPALALVGYRLHGSSGSWSAAGEQLLGRPYVIAAPAPRR